MHVMCHGFGCWQVRESVRKGVIDMAKSNLEQEQLISEVKNHIAIVRCDACCTP